MLRLTTPAVLLAAGLVASAAALAAPANAQPGMTITGDRTYIVGLDIAPGTYVTAGAPGCYWERLSGLGGTFGEIITNGSSDGQQYVTISPSDAGFSHRPAAGRGPRAPIGVSFL